jgi:replication-associated recombination protein RarA
MPMTATPILLYGPPGTGKTSFACPLADQLGTPACDIVRDETNVTSSRRAVIRARLNMTNTGSGSLVIVDEADNLLNPRFSFDPQNGVNLSDDHRCTQGRKPS